MLFTFVCLSSGPVHDSTEIRFQKFPMQSGLFQILLVL